MGKDTTSPALNWSLWVLASCVQTEQLMGGKRLSEAVGGRLPLHCESHCIN